MRTGEDFGYDIEGKMCGCLILREANENLNQLI